LDKSNSQDPGERCKAGALARPVRYGREKCGLVGDTQFRSAAGEMLADLEFEQCHLQRHIRVPLPVTTVLALRSNIAQSTGYQYYKMRGHNLDIPIEVSLNVSIEPLMSRIYLEVAGLGRYDPGPSALQDSSEPQLLSYLLTTARINVRWCKHSEDRE
jgi:hypothetical protein